MTSSWQPRALVMRLAVVALLVAALVGLGLHQHDGHAPDSHCVICKFAASLAPLLATVLILLIMPPPAMWSLGPAPRTGFSACYAAPLGLRAPPAV